MASFQWRRFRCQCAFDHTFEAPSPLPPSELDPTGENIFTGDGTLNGRILIGLIIGGVIALLACYALYLCRMTCRRHPKKSTEEEPVRLRDSKASAPNRTDFQGQHTR